MRPEAAPSPTLAPSSQAPAIPVPPHPAKAPTPIAEATVPQQDLIDSTRQAPVVALVPDRMAATPIPDLVGAKPQVAESQAVLEQPWKQAKGKKKKKVAS